MSVQAIVFDFDGVLADSEPVHLRVYQELLAPSGVTLTKEAYCERYLGFDDEGAFRQMAADFNLLLGDEEIEMLIVEKARRPWDTWLTHAAAALIAATLSATAVTYLLVR